MIVGRRTVPDGELDGRGVPGAGFSGVPCPQHPTSHPSPPSPSSALHHLLPPAAPVAKPVFTPWGNFNCLCVCVYVVSVCVCVIALSVSREYVCMCVPFAFPVALFFYSFTIGAKSPLFHFIEKIKSPALGFTQGRSEKLKRGGRD